MKGGKFITFLMASSKLKLLHVFCQYAEFLDYHLANEKKLTYKSENKTLNIKESRMIC